MLFRKVTLVRLIAFSLSAISIVACADLQSLEGKKVYGELVGYHVDKDNLYINYLSPGSYISRGYVLHRADDIFPCLYNISVMQEKKDGALIIDGSCQGQGAQIFKLKYNWLDKYKDLCLILVQEGVSADQISRAPRVVESRHLQGCSRLGDNLFFEPSISRDKSATVSVPQSFIYSDYNEESKTKKYLVYGDVIKILDSKSFDSEIWYFFSYLNKDKKEVYGWIKSSEIEEL